MKENTMENMKMSPLMYLCKWKRREFVIGLFFSTKEDNKSQTLCDHMFERYDHLIIVAYMWYAWEKMLV